VKVLLGEAEAVDESLSDAVADADPDWDILAETVSAGVIVAVCVRDPEAVGASVPDGVEEELRLSVALWLALTVPVSVSVTEGDGVADAVGALETEAVSVPLPEALEDAELDWVALTETVSAGLVVAVRVADSVAVVLALCESVWDREPLSVSLWLAVWLAVGVFA
jgi:hypothetical protein